MNIVKFRSDTKYRKQFFSGLSFSHPSKMHLSLQLWLIENFTKEGETILDPMAGSGTILVACSLGRNIICVELEQKFVDMMEGNWEKVKQRGPQLGYQMGTATILQGDARNLTGILVDKIITSPQYGEATQKLPDNYHIPITGSPQSKGTGEVKLARYSNDPNNLGNLPYGSIDAVISLAAYEATFNEKQHTLSGIAKRDPSMRKEVGGYSGKVDALISSPPYEASVSASTGGERDQSSARQRERRLLNKGYDPAEYQGGIGRNLEVDFQYSKESNNIGNLKADSYLAAMLQVYQQCFAVLKDGGLMILVTKNFIRNKKQVRLDLDTINLCEQAGFTFQDRWYRELASQSFWRIIYHQKYPDVEPIKYEDVLIFIK